MPRACHVLYLYLLLVFIDGAVLILEHGKHTGATESLPMLALLADVSNNSNFNDADMFDAVEELCWQSFTRDNYGQ